MGYHGGCGWSKSTPDQTTHSLPLPFPLSLPLSLSLFLPPPLDAYLQHLYSLGVNQVGTVKIIHGEWCNHNYLVAYCLYNKAPATGLCHRITNFWKPELPSPGVTLPCGVGLPKSKHVFTCFHGMGYHGGRGWGKSTPEIKPHTLPFLSLPLSLPTSFS